MPPSVASSLTSGGGGPGGDGGNGGGRLPPTAAGVRTCREGTVEGHQGGRGGGGWTNVVEGLQGFSWMGGTMSPVARIIRFHRRRHRQYLPTMSRTDLNMNLGSQEEGGELNCCGGG